MTRRSTALIGMALAGALWALGSGCQDQAKPGPKTSAQTAQAPSASANMATLSPGQGTATPSQTEPNQPRLPKIEFKTREIDVGKVRVGGKQTAEFEFSNTGTDTLVITAVRGCCGSSAKADKMRLAPGEQGVITWERSVSADTEYGVFVKEIVVQTNDKRNSLVRLTVKATLVETFRWRPTDLKLFLNRPNAGCPPIVLAALDQRPFSIKEVLVTDNCMAFTIDPNALQTEFVLEPKLDIEKLKAAYTGTIRFFLDRDDFQQVGIRYDLLPAYSRNPMQFIEFKLDPNVPLDRKVSILDNYCDANRPADFQIESMVSDANTVQVVSTTRTTTGYELDVRIKAPVPLTRDSGFRDALRVRIKGSDEVVVVPFNCYYDPKVLEKVPWPKAP